MPSHRQPRPPVAEGTICLPFPPLTQPSGVGVDFLSCIFPPLKNFIGTPLLQAWLKDIFLLAVSKSSYLVLNEVQPLSRE